MNRRAGRRLVLIAENAGRFPLRTMLRGLPDSELLVLEMSGRSADEVVPVALIEEFGERLRVVDVADPMDRSSVLNSADLLLCCDPPELGRSLPMEAMACGLPVVACCPESVDAVLPRLTGIHAYDAHPNQLSRAVSGLLADPVAWQAMSVGAVDRAEVRYGWPTVAADAARIYRTLLEPAAEQVRVRPARSVAG